MKVLIVIPAFPPDLEKVKGGVNAALSNLLKGFSYTTVVVRVISFNRSIEEPVIVKYANNIDIYYTPESKLPHAINFAFRGSAILKKHIRQFDPAVVHYAMSGYILLTRMFGLLNRVQVVTIHGMPFAEARLKINKREKLVYYTNGMAERLLCPPNIIHISGYSLAQYSNKNKKTVIIPNAIKQDYFEIPIKKNTSNKLVYAGSIAAGKNILYILEALKALIEKQIYFSLSVLGGFTDELYKEKVLTFISSNNLQQYVTLHGWMSQPEVQAVLATSDILVVASRQETLPMVIAEAMSAGKVVVASTVGGIPGMINDGEDGFLFDLSAIGNLPAVLERLYNNDPLMQRIQVAARLKAIDTYHCEKVAQKTISFYQSLVHDQEPAGIV